MLELPTTPTEMRRVYRLLSRAACTEAAYSLSGEHRTRLGTRTRLELRCDTAAHEVSGSFSYAYKNGRRHDHILTRIQLATDGSIWVAEADPPLRGWLLDRADQALRQWLASALGQELHDLLYASAMYGEALVALASHLDAKARDARHVSARDDLVAEAYERGAKLAVLLFTSPGTDRRAVAAAMAGGWRGGLAELLHAADDVLAEPGAPEL